MTNIYRKRNLFTNEAGEVLETFKSINAAKRANRQTKHRKR